MKGFSIYVKNDLLDPKHVANMEAAIWLYLWLLDKMTSINENGVGRVLGNAPITYSQIYIELGIPERTYNRWVSRLRKYGYINTVRTPHGLVFNVTKASKLFKRSAKSGVSQNTVIRQNVHSDPPKHVKSSAKLADVYIDDLFKDNTKTKHPAGNNKNVKKQKTQKPQQTQKGKGYDTFQQVGEILKKRGLK